MSSDEYINPLKRKKGVSINDKYKRNVIKQAKHTNWIGKIIVVKNYPSVIFEEWKLYHI